MQSASAVYHRDYADGVRPEPDQTVSEWSDSYRILSSRGAAEPGRWRTSRTPYLREIMDNLSPSSPIEETVVMKGTQLGFTEVGNNALGYWIDYAPGPAMMVQPTVEIAKRVSKSRIDPMIRDVPRLRAKVPEARSRDSGNTIMSKEFPGGILIFAGANSAASLSNMPVRYLFGDELDRYKLDVDEEGDPLGLAIERTNTFARRKLFFPSTPTIDGVSQIQKRFERGDQRYYFVPCPRCHHMQTLVWERVRWSDLGLAPQDAVYVCEACGGAIENREKAWMLPRGEWRPTAESVSDLIRSYHLNGLYRPVGWRSWGEMALLFLDARGNWTETKRFINTSLGLPYREKGRAPDSDRLYERREPYRRSIVPLRGLILTAGVDVQGDRLEVEIVAWGRDLESWSIDYVVLPGDPAHRHVWDKLAELFRRVWPHEAGTEFATSISKMCVDTGFESNLVYSWIREQHTDRIVGVKGESADRVTIPVATHPTKVDITRGGKTIKGGLQIWRVGGAVLKDELYSWLRRAKPEEGETSPGYCHFPEYDKDYFKQLTAEQKLTRKSKKGYLMHEWVLPSGSRNEALDCRIYARAAAHLLRLDSYTADNWLQIERAMGVEPTPEPEEEAPAEPADGGVFDGRQPEPKPAPVRKGRRIRGRFV